MPGEILREDFLKPLGISINRLSRDLSVPPNRISEIVNGKRAITADTALRLERYFGIEAQFWDTKTGCGAPQRCQTGLVDF